MIDIANRVFLGDCREILKDFPENSVAACLTDPPYNYEFIGHQWNADEIRRRTSRIQGTRTLVTNIPYGSALSGGVRNKRWYERVRNNIKEYEDWCFEWSKAVFRICKPGAITAAFSSTRTLAHIQVALERAGFYTRDCIVYRRSSGIPKGLNISEKMRQKKLPQYESWNGWHSALRNEWEAIVIVQKPLVNNYIETATTYGVGLFHTENEDGTFQSNIIEGVQKDRNEKFNVHCTVKPLSLMKKLIDLCVPPYEDNIVLDPFAGSGTTLVAAKESGRKYVGIEIVPEYMDIIDKRLRNARTQLIWRMTIYWPARSSRYPLMSTLVISLRYSKVLWSFGQSEYPTHLSYTR